MIELIKNFLIVKSIEIGWIILVFVIGRILLSLLVRKLAKISNGAAGNNKDKLAKRTETLKHVVMVNGSIIINVIIFVMVLNLFGLNIAPILAGLGVAGLAIGFGAQALIKDFVSGFLILAENQFNIGDKVKIGDAVGIVDKVTLRSTILKDEEGKTCYIANGSITNVVNFSQR